VNGVGPGFLNATSIFLRKWALPSKIPLPTPKGNRVMIAWSELLRTIIIFRPSQTVPLPSRKGDTPEDSTQRSTISLRSSSIFPGSTWTGNRRLPEGGTRDESACFAELYSIADLDSDLGICEASTLYTESRWRDRMMFKAAETVNF
jgi:hypothetical protein